MIESPQDPANFLETFLSRPEGKKQFREAVLTAFREAHGSRGGPYNIDTMAYLSAAIECHQYAASRMVGTPRFESRIPHLTHAVKSIRVPGPVLEFGVYSGVTINHMANLLPERQLYGFDSFKGLPEGWSALKKGHFAVDALPPVRQNVELVVGYFDRTLLPFLDTHEFEQISLLHVDCDLYTSTQTVFSLLHERIRPGTIIVFDEYWNYPDWKKHEFQAFQEYVNFRNIRYEYIGCVPGFEMVSVRIL